MKASRMRDLERSAADFFTSNHTRFLQEALQVLRDPGLQDEQAPLDALRLLAALQGSSYAARRDEKTALGQVGAWLEGWLLKRPSIGRDELAQDIGWLIRLSRVSTDKHEKQKKAAEMDRGGAAGYVPQPTAHQFGQNLRGLEDRRRLVSQSDGARDAGGLKSAPCEAPAESHPDLIASRLESIGKQNAAQEIPRLLASLTDPDEKTDTARKLLAKLKRKWFEERADKPWAKAVLDLCPQKTPTVGP